MKQVAMLKRCAQIGFGTVAVLLTTGCTRTVVQTEVREVIVGEVSDAPGVIQYAWEEPMVDVVQVPPGLDPEGHYYRPGHQAVQEVRPGRWRHYGQQ
jgi:hypothetical protein